MHTDDDETSYTLATFLVAGLVVFLLLLWVRAAPGSAVCLSKAEARQLWPKQHIYWYSKDRCWSNRRGGPPRGLKFDPIIDHQKSTATIPKNAMAKAEPESPLNDFKDFCCWPILKELDEYLKSKLLDYVRGYQK